MNQGYFINQDNWSGWAGGKSPHSLAWTQKVAQNNEQGLKSLVRIVWIHESKYKNH